MVGAGGDGGEGTGGVGENGHPTMIHDGRNPMLVALGGGGGAGDGDKNGVEGGNGGLLIIKFF